MRRTKNRPHWIKHTHLFDETEYECSVCGRTFYDSYSVCPNCNARLEQIEDTMEWIEEEEMLDIILSDD